MVLVYLHLRVVLSCSNCGSRATRGQWQRREGCPTCGSDLHT
jgi:predicted  nucleic acid-binding Zn-ribbon protein